MQVLLSLLFASGVLILAVNELRGMRRTKARQSIGADWETRRRRALSTRPEALATVIPAGEVYGVLMEMASPATTLTLEAFADGRASVYSSAGGEVLQVGEDAQAVEAAKAFIEAARALKGVMKPVSQCPRPAFGNVRFNLISAAGVLAIEEDERALEEGWSPFTPVYGAGVRTIQALREAFSQAGPGPA